MHTDIVFGVQQYTILLRMFLFLFLFMLDLNVRLEAESRQSPIGFAETRLVLFLQQWRHENEKSHLGHNILP
jgi:hypothetical protein